MFDTYKPSGRLSPSFLLWLSVGVLLAIAAAFVYQLGLYWIPLIYVNFLLTLGMGMLVGFICQWVVKRGKIRNVPIALLCLLMLVGSALIGKFGFQYLRARSEMRAALGAMDFELQPEDGQPLANENMDQIRDTILAQYTFMQHIQDRVESGWQLGKAGRANGGNPINGVVVYLVWAVEAGAVLYMSLGSTIAAAKQPFSEKMGVWADEKEVVMTLPITGEEMVSQIQQASTVQELLELPIPKSDQSDQFAVYTVSSIPGQEMEDAYLTVDWQTHSVNAKGEKEVKSKILVADAIISTDQRHQLKENAEIMNEAFAAYRASLQQEQANPHDENVQG